MGRERWITTPEQRQPRWREHDLAGWWRRACALTIDTFIVIVIGIPFDLLTGNGFWTGRSLSTGDQLAALGYAAVATLIYYAPLMIGTNGQTLGKKAVGIRVIRADGRPVSLSVVAVREVFAKQLSFGVGLVGVWLPGAGAVLLIDSLFPLWDHENRALHDMLARTRVVRVRR